VVPQLGIAGFELETGSVLEIVRMRDLLNVLATAALFSVASSLLAQAPTTPAMNRVGVTDTGVHPYGAYDGTNEHINLENNNVNISVPLLSLPGRNGDDLKLSLIYDSNMWGEQAEWENLQPGPHWITQWAIENKFPYIADGWNLSWPTIIGTGGVIHYKNGQSGDNYLSCTGSTTVMLSDGSRHIFNNNEGCFNLVSPLMPANVEIPVMDSEDTDGMQINHQDYPDSNAPNGHDYVVTLRNGTKIFFNGIPTYAAEYSWVISNVTGLPAYKIVDANGNVISLQAQISNNVITSMTITDTVGRTVTVVPNSGISYTDVNGTPQTISFQIEAESIFAPDSQTSFGEDLLNSVTINSGSAEPQKYAFSYDQNGELSNVTYPHGGCTGYKYATFPRILIVPPLGSPGNNLIAPIPGITTKYVSPTGVCDSSAPTTIYSATPAPDTGEGTVNNTEMDITFPDNTIEKHKFTEGSMDSSEQFHGITGHEKEVTTYSSTSAPLKDVLTAWTGSTTWDLPSSITTTFYPSNKVMMKAMQYDTITAQYQQSFYINNLSAGEAKQPPVQTVNRYLDAPTMVTTYGYGAGSPGAIVQNITNTYQDYTASNVRILGLIHNSFTTDGTYSFASAYAYDGGSLASSGAAVQHQDPGAVARGDMTMAQRCIANSSSTTPSSCTQWITTTYAYDDAGNMVSAFDGMNYQTQFSWLDSWSSTGNSCPQSGNTAAYLTKITNAMGVSTKANYRKCTGARDYLTDLNGNPTTYTFDSLGRIESESLPDSGGTGISYNDAADQVTFSKKLDSSRNITNLVTYDGIGRLIRTQLTSDPDGGDSVDTAYDGRDRKVSVSNPYRGAAPASDGTTGYAYDGLNRVYQTTHYPDNSSISTDYSAFPCVTVTDEMTHQRKACSDALGRTTTVVEDPSGLNYETDYAYDAMNNLLSVKQWGGALNSPGARMRSFSYDGLSRLQSATNPESGTVTYTYDADSNVHTKTDARGVTATYQYDKLNRVLSKSYSDSTPWSCFQYDSSTHGVGLLSSAWTQSASVGTCASSAPTSGFWTMRSILAYDLMGRIWNEQQFTPASQATGASYTPAYTYDLAGNLLSSSDGIAPTPTPGTVLGFASAYSEAGRLLTVTSNWVDAKHPATLFSAQTGQSTSTCPNASTTVYAPFGGLQNATLGSGLTLNRTYDARLRTTCEMDLGTGVSPATSGTATVGITGVEQTQ
jgi:YD repeat-containing protein